MDVMRLEGADGTRRFASNFAGYGFYGDVIALSESMRWMGPARRAATSHHHRPRRRSQTMLVTDGFLQPLCCAPTTLSSPLLSSSHKRCRI